MVLQMENSRKKIIPARNILLVIVAYAVNIFQLSVKYRWIQSLDIDVGDCGICSKYFSTLGEIPTKIFRLELCRWVFKKKIKKLFRISNIKLYKLIVKKSIMQIKLY